MDTYLPAVQTANNGEDTARGAMQSHVVSLQDEVTQLQAMQGLALGRVQATHQAAGADVNGALEEEKAGILSSTALSAPSTHRTLAPAALPSLCPALWPHLQVAVLQDTPSTQMDWAFQQAADHRAPRAQELRLL